MAEGNANGSKYIPSKGFFIGKFVCENENCDGWKINVMGPEATNRLRK